VLGSKPRGRGNLGIGRRHVRKTKCVRALLAPTIGVTALVVAGQPAFARRATTTPGVVYTVKVVLTNTSISIARDKFTRTGTIQYARGAVIHYAITNHGSRPYVLRIWDKQTATIEPGGHGAILVTWNYRGEYHYTLLYRGRPAGLTGNVIIY
jgi:hypothetical protein